MTAAFTLAIGCIFIQFAIIVLVAVDNVKTSQRCHEKTIENARLLALYDAVTYIQRGMHKNSGKTHDADCAGERPKFAPGVLQINRAEVLVG